MPVLVICLVYLFFVAIYKHIYIYILSVLLYRYIYIYILHIYVKHTVFILYIVFSEIGMRTSLWVQMHYIYICILSSFHTHEV